MLWTALVTFPLMASIQLICARIGLVCGCGLAGVMRRHYPPTLVYMMVLSLVIATRSMLPQTLPPLPPA